MMSKIEIEQKLTAIESKLQNLRTLNTSFPSTNAYNPFKYVVINNYCIVFINTTFTGNQINQGGMPEIKNVNNIISLLQLDGEPSNLKMHFQDNSKTWIRINSIGNTEGKVITGIGIYEIA